MNIYIWQEVLCDYSCGMAVAIAETKEKAIALFEADEEHSGVRANLEAVDPLVIPADTRVSQGYYVWGGG